MATSPLFAGSHSLATVALTNQTITRDAQTGSGLALFTAGISGSLIEAISIYPVGTIADNVIRLFITYPGETSKLLLTEKSITEVASVSNTAAIPGYPIYMDLFNILLPSLAGQTALKLPASAFLTVGIGTAETNAVHVTAHGNDY